MFLLESNKCLDQITAGRNTPNPPRHLPQTWSLNIANQRTMISLLVLCVRKISGIKTLVTFSIEPPPILMVSRKLLVLVDYIGMGVHKYSPTYSNIISALFVKKQIKLELIRATEATS